MENFGISFSISLLSWQTLLLVVLLVWTYCLIDIIRHKFRNDGKITWFLIVFFLPILGSALYLSTGKTRRVIFN